MSRLNLRSDLGSIGLTALALIAALALTTAQPRESGQAAGEWPVATPESQGIDSGGIAAAIESLREREAPIHSLLIVRNGKLVTEASFYPYDGRTPHDIASVTKPITTTLVGLAIARGHFSSVSESMLSIFQGGKGGGGWGPIANIDERKRAVQLLHLLTMSSGLGIKTQGGEPTLWEMLSAPDNVGFMLDLPMSDEPGTKYAYNSGGMHLLSGAISQRTGRSAEELARATLFRPLGIRSWNWPRDPQNVSHGFGNLHLLPRDMAKIGWLFLEEGRWNGRQVIPAEWVAAATRAHIKTGGPGTSDYGYGWRVPTNGSPVSFEASGRGGQQISVLKKARSVIVINGGGFSSGELMKQIFGSLQSDSPLPENPAALARLRRAIEAAARPPAPRPSAPLPVAAGELSKHTWQMPDNWLGLQSLAIRFNGNAPTATATLTFGPALKRDQFGLSAKVAGNGMITESRPVGLDGVLRLSEGGILGLPVALRGSWLDDQTFQLEYNEVANTNTYFLKLRPAADGLHVEASERTGLFKEGYTATHR
jgi:CubicO group peptidase (beta-lactamase class C family)